jgi:hypothetical protein
VYLVPPVVAFPYWITQAQPLIRHGLGRFLFSALPLVLHRTAFPVVSEWCQTV